METGKSALALSEELFNRELRSSVMDFAGQYVTDYSVSFNGGYINVHLHLKIKTLGDVEANYRLKVTDFVFDLRERKVTFDYLEDVRSKGNPGQALLLKAFQLRKGSVLQSALDMARLSGCTANQNSCSVELEQLLPQSKGPLDHLDLFYRDSRNGLLQFFFSIR